MKAGNVRAAETIAQLAHIPFDHLRVEMGRVEEGYTRLTGRTGDQERAARTLQVQIIGLNEAWKNFALTTGQFVLPAITDSIKLFTDLIQGANDAAVAIGKHKGLSPEKAKDLPPVGQTPWRSWPMMLRELGPMFLGLTGMSKGQIQTPIPKGGDITGGAGMPNLRGAAGEDRLQDEETTEEGNVRRFGPLRLY
jgi:hypothetical protein